MTPAILIPDAQRSRDMLSLALAGAWGLAANIIALMPKRIHWPAAYVLMLCAVPVLIAVWSAHGIVIALIILLAMMSILRWPVLYALRWLRARLL